MAVEGWERGLEPQKGETPSSWDAGGLSDHGEASEGKDQHSASSEGGHCGSGEVGSPDIIGDPWYSLKGCNLGRSQGNGRPGRSQGGLKNQGDAAGPRGGAEAEPEGVKTMAKLDG